MIAFLDVETGGYSVTKNGVCEIGMVAVDHNLNKIAEFHCYIKPYTRADDTDELVSYKDDAMAVNSLTVDLLIEKGILVGEAMNKVWQFAAVHKIQTIIGHNVKQFDIPRVEHLLNRFTVGTFKNLDAECTLKMARDKWPHFSSHKLEDLCLLLNIPNPKKHTAIGDCYSNIELYKKLIA